MLRHGEPCTDGFCLEALIRTLPCTLAIPASSQALVSTLPTWDAQTPPARLLLFTDGSFCAKLSSASWAAAVFADAGEHDWRWAGCAAGRVHTDGPMAAPSAFEAELYALAAAFCVVLRSRPGHATCIYDSQSAAAVAHCVASTSLPHRLAASVRSLYLACVAAGVQFHFKHTYSHQGDPGNELVDALAGYCHGHDCLRVEDQDLSQILSWPEIHRLWMAVCTRDDLPLLQPDGQTPALHVDIPDRSSLTTPTQLAGLPDSAAPRRYGLDLRLATYNTLSLRSHLQQQALAKLFQLHRRHIIGLQETRLDIEGLAHYGAYTAFCSPADNGTEGIQLWVDFATPVTVAQSPDVLCFRRDTFCIRHAEPRLLLVTGCLADIRLLFVVGHAPTSTQPDSIISQWWDHLDAQVRRIPRGFCPIFLLDANARFRPSLVEPSATAAEPENCNAEALLSVAAAHSLCLSGLRDADGNAIVSWVSPSGNAACLDFVAVPDVWATNMCTRPAPANFCDQFAGIDHHPVYVDLALSLSSRPASKNRLPSARALRSPAGHARLCAIWRSVPQVPWHVDVDSHLAIINAHLRRGLMDGFDHPPHIAHPAMSPAAWDMLREQRQLRRILFRLRHFLQKDTMAAVFQVWRRGLPEVGRLAHAARQHRCRLHMARTARAIQACRRRLRGQSKIDRANFTREMFQTARSREDLPHLLRSILRTGRRYKAPALVPNMEVAPGVPCATREEFLAHAGKHFARAERAIPTQLSELPAVYRGHSCMAPVHLEDLPTLEELTRAFARLKGGRAPGLTGLLPEVYKGCPDLAALAHWALSLKAVSAGTHPLLWMGGVATPIPKPSKSPSVMAGWRSILLQECSGKAVAAALRERLLAGLEKQAPDGMAGARRGVPLTLPCHLVGRHLDRLRQAAGNGAVLFVDGEAAFYATVRCFLDPQHGHHTLDAWVDSLHEDSFITDAVKAMLRAHDVLAAGQVAFAVRDALRNSIACSWYTALPSDGEIYQAVTGTVPGAPLADLLFQLTFVMCITRVTEALAATGHCARLPVAYAAQDVPCTHPTWMDDVALLLQASCCTHVAPAVIHAASVMQSMLRAMGVAMNLLPGKTEGLLVLHGSGSRAERHRLFVDLDGKLPFSEAHDGVLQLTDSYVHLGVMVGAQCMARKHIDRRARFAELSFLPLRRRLLPNPHLSVAEKTELLRAFALGRLTHGLDQWTLAADKDFKAFHTAYMSLLRRSVRPIAHCSSACLRDEQVCAVLHVLSPREAHIVALTRSLGQVASSNLHYLQCLLHVQQEWLSCSVAAANVVLHTVGSTAIPAVPVSPIHLLTWCQDVGKCLGRVSLTLRKFCNHVLRSRRALAAQAISQAKCRAALEAQGVLLQHIPDTAQDRPRTVVCPVCHKHFATVAAEGAHARRVHGRVALHTQALRGTACLVCRREYWTSARLREHFRFSSSCCHTYIEADLGPPLPCEQNCAGPVGAACKPITVLIGPQPWWASLQPTQVLPAVAEALPQSWLERELLCQFAQLGTPGPDTHLAALKSAVRLHSLASGEFSECLADLVYPSHDGYWYSVFAAVGRVLCAERQDAEQPSSAGVVQKVGRWVLLRPAGLRADTDCLKDGS